MSTVWLTIPSARPPEEAEKCLKLWRERGYKIALWLDADGNSPAAVHSENALTIWGGYPGYAQAVNSLICQAMQFDREAEFFIAAGDDTEPDPDHSAEEIAYQCVKYFGSFARNVEQYSTFGVMQPTGDRFAGGSIDRIAGSAWYGREYCKRVNGGRGPLWPEYRHMFVDSEAQCVAEKLGVFWHRPDLIHLHHHFTRASDALDSGTKPTQIPSHLLDANSPEHWNKYKALFESRRAAGFPGHEPLAISEAA